MSSFAGRLLYRLYHQPLGTLRQSIAEGGPFVQRRTAAGRRAMADTARHLPQLPPAPPPALELHLLTGRRFWEQTAFCLWTFARHARAQLAPVIYDDGTLRPEQSEIFTRLFPRTRLVSQPKAIERLDELLPARRFPTLRERWENYPNIRKLIDPHLGSTGWKLVIDSDLLFFRRPQVLITWLEAPGQPLHAVDCETAYGYSRPLMEELAGATVAERVNVGLCGLNSTELDWDKLEFWCRTLIERERTHYYLEQALVAMLLAGRPCTIAPAGDYVTCPSPTEAQSCTAVMHHYVANSKRWYFQHDWKVALRDDSAPSNQVITSRRTS